MTFSGNPVRTFPDHALFNCCIRNGPSGRRASRRRRGLNSERHHESCRRSRQSVCDAARQIRPTPGRRTNSITANSSSLATARTPRSCGPWCPSHCRPIGDTVAYEVIRMPDSTGFGDYTETGQVIPVRFTTPSGEVQEGGYVHAMYLDDNSPIAGGREIWGFPKKLATPKIVHERELWSAHCTTARFSASSSDDGLQAPGDRSGACRKVHGEAGLHDQDHSPRGREPHASASWFATTCKTSR